MPKLAVLILAYNEEQHIAECIDSASFADEVIVIDSGSTDRTVEIAQQHGAKVAIKPMTEGFAAQRNFALTQTDADWVIYLDSDERITAELANEIMTVIDRKPSAYAMPRRNIAFGTWLKHGGWYPDYVVRLYPRTAVTWQGIVHEEPCFSIGKQNLKSDLIHYTYYDWERYFNKFNSYTTMMAERMQQRGKKAKQNDIVFRPFWSFIRVYVLRSGWRDGLMGFIMAVFHAFYTMAKYVKLYYIYNKADEKQ